jgi:hypothetical protein
MLKIFLKKNETREEYLGIDIPFTSPYHLFVKKTDIDQDKNNLKWVCYSIGSKKIVLWGKYSRREYSFELEGGCRYDLIDINKYLKVWKKDYKFTYETVYNRVKSTIDDFLDIKKFVADQDTYQQVKYFLSSSEDSIYFKDLRFKKYLEKPYEMKIKKFLKENMGDYKDISNEFSMKDSLDDDEQELLWSSNPLRKLEKQVKEYEKDLNFRTHLINLNFLKKMNEDFYDYIKYGRFENDMSYKKMQKCPKSPYDCVGQKHCELFFDEEALDLDNVM